MLFHRDAMPEQCEMALSEVISIMESIAMSRVPNKKIRKMDAINSILYFARRVQDDYEGIKEDKRKSYVDGRHLKNSRVKAKNR